MLGQSGLLAVHLLHAYLTRLDPENSTVRAVRSKTQKTAKVDERRRKTAKDVTVMKLNLQKATTIQYYA